MHSRERGQNRKESLTRPVLGLPNVLAGGAPGKTPAGTGGEGWPPAPTASGRAASLFRGDPVAFVVAQHAVRDLGRTEETFADHLV